MRNSIIIFLFAFILYSGTFEHDYVLDDNDVIAVNDITHKGIDGISQIFKSSYRVNTNYAGDELYRPLSRALFSIEWEIWPAKPGAAHVVNVIIYALISVLVYRLLLNLLKSQLVPFIASVLFAALPIHTEAVSNIKSADDLLALLFALISLLLVLKYWNSKRVMYLIFSLLTFFISMLSKESAVVFIAVIPLCVYFFTPVPAKKNLLITALYLIPLLLYLVIRYNVVGQFDARNSLTTNYLIDIPDFFTRTASAIRLLGYYLLIIVFPYRLISDGSYNEFPAVSIGSWQFIVSFLVMAAMFVYAVLNFRKRKTESFAILYFFFTVSIVSNIFVLIGTNYGERLMLTPSIGIVLLIAVILVRFVKTGKPQKFILFEKPVLVSLLLVLPYSVKTMVREKDWKNELTLFSKDADAAPNSARLQYYLGNQYAVNFPALVDENEKKGYAEKGLTSLHRALDIFPRYDEACYSIGEIYSYSGNLDSAGLYYERAARINPANARFLNNYADIMFKKDNIDTAMKYFKLAVKYDDNYRDAWVNLGTTYARVGQKWLEQAQKAQQDNQPATFNEKYKIAMTYLDSGITNVNHALEIDPQFSHAYRILGIIYQNKNDTVRANEYNRKAQELTY
jgi:Tfp pilus assembly protein PilF